MIKLYEFQQKEVRTDIIDNDIWFSGHDVHAVLGLTWRGGNYLRTKGGIPTKWITQRGVTTVGGLQDMLFINEQALYKLIFTSNPKDHKVKKQVESFQIWVAELLVSVRKSIDSGRKDDLRKHLYTDVQNGFSKSINAKNFNEGGVSKTIEYNQENCILHTGMRPSAVIEVGKNLGLKSKDTSSAKQVLRSLKPEIACAMSFTDKLVSENGVDHKIAAKTSKDFAEPLFKKLMELGINKKELE